MKLEHYGIFWGLLAAVANSVVAICIKLAGNVPYETMVFLRFFIAFLFVVPYVLNGKVHLHVKFVPKHLVRALAGLGSIYCYFYSVTKLPLVNAVTLSNTTPLFLPVVVFFWMKMILPMSRIVALCVGFAGVLFIIKPGAAIEEWSTLVGLVGALSSAFALVGVRQLSRTESTETIMAYYFLIAAVVLFIPMLITWKPIHSPVVWLHLFLIGVSSVVYQYCMVRSLTHLPATKMGMLNYLSVVFSGLFGWWLFGEVPDLWVAAGVVLIIAGGVIAVMSKASVKKR